MPATETFGIEVEIGVKGDGAKAIDKTLDGLEKHAKGTGDAIDKAIGGGMIDAAAKAQKAGDEAARAFAKASEGARAAARDEQQWAAAIDKAKAALGAQTAAIGETTKAIATAKDGVAAYDKALADSTVSATKAASASTDMLKGWKDVTKTMGEVGLAINTVRQGVELAKQAFDVAKVAAREMGEAWRAALNSGPSAYVGGSFRQEARLRKLGEKLGGDYSSGGSVPADLKKYIEDSSIAESEFDAAIAKYRSARYQAVTDADAKFRANENARVVRAAEYAKTHRAEMEKAQAEVDKIQAQIDERIAREKAAADGAGGGRRGSKAAAGPTTAETLAAFDLVDNIREVKLFAETLGAVTVAAESATVATQKLYAIPPPPVGEWAQLGDTLKGPLSNALDDVIGQIATMTFDLKSLFRSLAEEIARALIQMLLLQAIKASFSSTSGGLGGFLWDLAGGKEGGASARYAPGDSFGGGASNAGGGAVFREPVQKRTGGDGGGGGGGGAVYNKIVVVADMRAAALEALKSKEGEQATIVHVANNKGKLGAAR